jgi:hypothetical protein
MKNLEGINEYRIINRDKSREFRINKSTEENPNFVPNYSWKTRQQARMNFESIASLLHITDLSDWYRISLDQIKLIGGIVILFHLYYSKILSYLFIIFH